MPPGKLPPGFRIEPAQPGEHFAIREFLVAVFQKPSEQDFARALDEPLYKPTDRLLIKYDGAIVAHVFIRKRVMRWGELAVPVGQVCELAALPEYRGLGLASTLLRAAEQQMLNENAVLAVTNTTLPAFFQPFDWGPYVPYVTSCVALRPLLRELVEAPVAPRLPFAPTKKLKPAITVRPWRQIELDSVRELYATEFAGKVFGAWERSEEYWRWLIEQRKFDRVYVATPETIHVRRKKKSRGRPRADLETLQPADVIAYAVQRGDQILELVAKDGNVAYCKSLVARICSDVLEQGFHELTLHAPPNSPAHAWFNAAGRATQQLDNLNGRFLMGKILDANGILKTILPLLNSRLPKTQSGSWNLGLRIGNHNTTLVSTNNQLHVEPNTTTRNNVTLSQPAFLRLVCGQADLDQEIAAGTICTSTKLAHKRLAPLFPITPFTWQIWDR